MWADPLGMLAELDLYEAAVKQLSSWQFTAKPAELHTVMMVQTQKS
jgi:hypothetical protein